MAQNRPPPAFMEYAAAMMAKVEYRILTLPERGLLYSMRLECWVNCSVPASPAILARVLGYQPADVTAALPSVLPFFRQEGAVLVSPELEDYRAHLSGIREKQAAGGKQGAAMTNGKRSTAKTKAGQGKAGDSSNPQVTRASTRESLVQSKPTQSNPTQSLETGDKRIDADWVNAYEKESNGR